MSDGSRPTLDSLARMLCGTDLQAMMVDASGRVVYATTRLESLLGASDGTLVGTTLDSLFAPRNPEWLSCRVRREAADGRWSGDVAFRKRDEAECWVHIQAGRLPVESGDILLILEDISEHIEITNTLMRRAEELYDRNWELEIINKVGRLMLADTELEPRLNAILREAARSADTDCGAVMIKNPSTHELVCRSVFGDSYAHLQGKLAIMADEDSIAVRTVKTRRTHVIPNLAAEPDFLRRIGIDHSVKSMLSVPLTVGDEAFGALMLGDSRRRAFDREEIALVEIITNHAASAIHSSLLSESQGALREDVRRAARLASVGELLAGTAHSFGNTLAAIRSELESLCADVAAREALPGAAERLDRALEHVEKGVQTVHRLLGFSRGTSDETESVSLLETTETAIALCASHPASRRKTIRNQVGPEIPPVSAHAGPLREAIFNLVLAALQGAEPGGEVRVEASVIGNGMRVELRIMDSGDGVGAGNTQNMLGLLLSDSGGSRLSLSASLAAIHRMDGTLIAGGGPGQGAAFTIRLNVADSRRSSEGRQAA